MDTATILQMVLRWIHFVSGITWIGILYFFNLVNVGFMKTLDAPTKGKVVPNLMTPALWYFRWGALITVLSGLTYFVWIVTAEGTPHHALGIWLVVTLVLYAVMYACIEVIKINSGPVLAIIFTLMVAAQTWAMSSFSGLASSRSISIGIGGGLGIWMLLNVWGIIWRAQKKVIAWTAENAAKGTPIPGEAAGLARRTFLASRTNTWLSLPMLWFMGTASHLAMFGV